MSDGTNSRVYYTANGAAGSLVWVEGASFAGAYTLIGPTSTRGTVMVYNPADGTSGTLYLIHNDASGFYGDNSGSVSVDITINGGAPTNVTVNATTDLPGVNTGLTVNTGDVVTISASGTWCFSGGGPLCPFGPDGSTNFDSACVLPSAAHGALIGRIDTIGNWFIVGSSYSQTIGGAGGNAAVRVSTDNGATVGSPITVGDTPGLSAGFDVQYIGGVSMAAADQALMIATSHGGAYSLHATFTGAQVACVVLPWGRQNATTANNLSVSDPDCIVALTAPDGGGGTLYWLDSTGSPTDITPVAGITFNSPNCIRSWLGTKITVIGQVSGVTKCYDSSDGGATWTLRGTVDGAVYIRGRRKRAKSGDATAEHQLFVAGGPILDFSASDGVTLAARIKPSANAAGIDVLN